MLLPTVVQFTHECVLAKGEPFAVARTKQWVKLLGKNYLEARILFESIKLCRTQNEITITLNGLQKTRTETKN